MAVVYRAALAAVQMRKTTGKSSGGSEITSANRAGVRARVRACLCVCVYAGLLLQYHAPLADELLCSSLVPSSAPPNQTCHDVSQPVS